MNRLEKLPDIAQRQLGGLEANTTLLCKIRLEAAERKEKPGVTCVWKPALALCCALVLCLGAVMTLNTDGGPVAADVSESNVMMASRAAGDETEEAAPTAQPAVKADVPRGSITMSAGAKHSIGSLFAQPAGSSFPLVTLKGATYRMLESPDAISSAMLGAELGAVTEFNLEPALGTSGVVSNVVSTGESIYAVGDMNGALVAARVDGAIRVFQRVSYAGTAVIGAETLRDTLCAPADVKWIEAEGFGRAEGEKAQQLMETLLEYATYQSTAFSGSASMQIGLANGLILQLMTGEDSISACGTWSCPDFFEAFADL